MVAQHIHQPPFETNQWKDAPLSVFESVGMSAVKKKEIKEQGRIHGPRCVQRCYVGFFGRACVCVCVYVCACVGVSLSLVIAALLTH